MCPCNTKLAAIKPPCQMISPPSPQCESEKAQRSNRFIFSFIIKKQEEITWNKEDYVLFYLFYSFHLLLLKSAQKSEIFRLWSFFLIIFMNVDEIQRIYLHAFWCIYQLHRRWIHVLEFCLEVITSLTKYHSYTNTLLFLELVLLSLGQLFKSVWLARTCIRCKKKNLD